MSRENPNHPITITPNHNRVRVVWHGTVIADTTRALDLKEATYPVVHYIPREDVAMASLSRTTHQTHCPYKGNAAYFSMTGAEQTAANAVWSYEAPIPAVSEIAGYLAFYPSKVDIEETAL